MTDPKALPNPLNVELVLSIKAELSEDQKARVARTVYGQGMVDHEAGYYSVSDGEKHKLARLHVSETRNNDLQAGKTALAGIDDIRFDDTIYIYLEDEQGVLTGWGDAKGLIQSKWHYGLIFTDTDGDAWFAGREFMDNQGGITADTPILRRVERAGFMNGERFDLFDLAETTASEGEFYLTYDDVGIVTEIPWWSGFGNQGDLTHASKDDEAVAARAQEDVILTALIERVAQMKLDAPAAAEPDMAEGSGMHP
jgi:hypothetical protein